MLTIKEQGNFLDFLNKSITSCIVALGSEVIKKSRKREKRNLGKAISSDILHLPDYYPPPWKCSYSATGNQTAHTKAYIALDDMERTRERDRRRAQRTAHCTHRMIPYNKWSNKGIATASNWPGKAAN
jgi:hypothetical protein